MSARHRPRTRRDVRQGALVALTDRPFLFLGLVAVNTVFALSSMMLAAVSPVASRGRYLAAFQYSFAFASIIAPVFFTSLTSIGMAAPWIGLAILDGASIIAILALERLLGGSSAAAEMAAETAAAANSALPGT